MCFLLVLLLCWGGKYTVQAGKHKARPATIQSRSRYSMNGTTKGVRNAVHDEWIRVLRLAERVPERARRSGNSKPGDRSPPGRNQQPDQPLCEIWRVWSGLARREQAVTIRRPPGVSWREVLSGPKCCREFQEQFREMV